MKRLKKSSQMNFSISKYSSPLHFSYLLLLLLFIVFIYSGKVECNTNREPIVLIPGYFLLKTKF